MYKYYNALNLQLKLLILVSELMMIDTLGTLWPLLLVFKSSLRILFARGRHFASSCCLRPGFNIQCHDNNWARWGFCLNCASQGCQNSDGNDADASIGIGLRGQSTNPPEMGAGWTEYFASGKGTCSHNSKTYKSVWIWAFDATPVAPVAPSASGWKLVMKVGSQTDKLGFSSPLWTNGELLNQNSPIQDSTDAKYAAYLDAPFKEIRMCIGSPESNCVTHKFSKSYGSAKALFSAGYIRDQTVKRDEILKAFGVTPGSYQDCPMQRSGAQ